nr:hypothetical protein CFP56_13382 [Quercus suber]
MQFLTVALAVLSVGVATTQAAICFDAGDCIFNGGGQCIKSAGSITGTCASTTGTPTATATSAASTASATGSICFDAGDCLLSGGGQCIKPANAILGNCAPAPKAARAEPLSCFSLLFFCAWVRCRGTDVLGDRHVPDDASLLPRRAKLDECRRGAELLSLRWSEDQQFSGLVLSDRETLTQLVRLMIAIPNMDCRLRTRESSEDRCLLSLPAEVRAVDSMKS